jgi:hypothetical protein
VDAIKIYRQSGARFERVAELSVEHNDTLTTPLLPALAATLTDVFAWPM